MGITLDDIRNGNCTRPVDGRFETTSLLVGDSECGNDISGVLILKNQSQDEGITVTLCELMRSHNGDCLVYKGVKTNNQVLEISIMIKEAFNDELYKSGDTMIYEVELKLQSGYK